MCQYDPILCNFLDFLQNIQPCEVTTQIFSIRYLWYLYVHSYAQAHTPDSAVSVSVCVSVSVSLSPSASERSSMSIQTFVYIHMQRKYISMPSCWCWCWCSCSCPLSCCIISIWFDIDTQYEFMYRKMAKHTTATMFCIFFWLHFYAVQVSLNSAEFCTLHSADFR